MTNHLPVCGFLNGLVASGPHPSLGRHGDTDGRLIGSWAGTFEDRHPDGRVHTGEMEVHFAWVLQGLTVQDVWIAPTRAQRAAGLTGGSRDTYGSTLRVFHPDIEAWRVVWLNPVKGVRNDLVGRRVGDDIVQTGWCGAAPIKWVFTHITREAFTWQGLTLAADGVSWRLDTEFRLRRTA